MMIISFDQALRHLTSGNDQLAESAVAHIASLQDQQVSVVLSALSELMHHGDADIRWWAVRALAEINAPQVPGLLVRMLDDRDASVRQCAALGLRLHPYQPAIGPLVNALYDHDPLVVSLATDALTTIGAPAVPALLDLLENAPQSIRLQAARSLAFIGDTRAIPALFTALDDDSTLIEYWANEGLERMGVGMVFFKP